MEALLDNKLFSRTNRQTIISVGAIEQIHTYFSNRLKLQIHPAPDDEVIVSKGKVKAFRQWLEGA